jgi:2TM domain
MSTNLNTHTSTLPQANLERQARRRASAKLGWYVHALVYLSVNLMLALLSIMSGKHWAVFPALGWGLGLLIHGVVVFVVTGGAGLHERLVQRERDRLSSQRDAW